MKNIKLEALAVFMCLGPFVIWVSVMLVFSDISVISRWGALAFLISIFFGYWYTEKRSPSKKSVTSSAQTQSEPHELHQKPH